MRSFFDPRQSGHAPAREMHNGDWIAYSETPARAEEIKALLGGCEAPKDFGVPPIAAVHDGAYLDFLRDAWRDWRDAGREGDAIPYVFPIVGRRDVELGRIDARLGRYSLDSGTPIAESTWDAAYWSAQSALSATAAVVGGERFAFALCRPPGHHAGRDYCGGYCYLNNAAIAAQAAIAAGAGPVAVLDVDYHHGNGTQDIFYARGDVGFVSIHADPATDYPFYWGHADERGVGPGEGATRNITLPAGTGWSAYREKLDEALATIASWQSRFLVVSFGADTFEADPICGFTLKREDYPLLGARIAAAGLPTVIVMEGGYAVDALGTNVAGFLSGFDQV
jgi:acetoin utilization deacetylase AcuC-like enzyme